MGEGQENSAPRITSQGGIPVLLEERPTGWGRLEGSVLGLQLGTRVQGPSVAQGSQEPGRSTDERGADFKENNSSAQ